VINKTTLAAALRSRILTACMPMLISCRNLVRIINKLKKVILPGTTLLPPRPPATELPSSLPVLVCSTFWCNACECCVLAIHWTVQRVRHSLTTTVKIVDRCIHSVCIVHVFLFAILAASKTMGMQVQYKTFRAGT
jgi:hypothetical protein